MDDSELKIVGDPNASTQHSWDERAIVDQIWNDLQGTVERSTIRQELTQVIPRFQDARVETYIPIFLHRVTVERLRAGVVGAVPTDTVEPAEAPPISVLDVTGETTEQRPISVSEDVSDE